MIDTKALDYRALTLPKIKLGIKLKKPKRPNLWSLIWLSNCILHTVGSSMYIIQGTYLRAMRDACFAAIFWRLYHLERQEQHRQVGKICFYSLPLIISIWIWP